MIPEFEYQTREEKLRDQTSREKQTYLKVSVLFKVDNRTIKKSLNNKTRDTLYLFYCCKNQFKIPFKPIRNPFQNTNHRVSYTKTTRD